MFILPNQKKRIVKTMVETHPVVFPLALACIQNVIEGSVYVDENNPPRYSIITTSYNWLCVVGTIEDKDIAKIEEKVWQLCETRTHMLCVFPASEEYSLQKSFYKLVRRQFVHNGSPLDTFAMQEKSIQIKQIHSKEYSWIASQYKDMNFYWRNYKDFTERSFGFYIAFNNSELIGVCLAVVFVDNIVEIDIWVKEEWRGHNMGYLLGSHFVNYCISNNIQVFWDCYLHNKPSLRLAVKLGFNPKADYNCYIYYGDFNA